MSSCFCLDPAGSSTWKPSPSPAVPGLHRHPTPVLLLSDDQRHAWWSKGTQIHESFDKIRKLFGGKVDGDTYCYTRIHFYLLNASVPAISPPSRSNSCRGGREGERERRGNRLFTRSPCWVTEEKRGGCGEERGGDSLIPKHFGGSRIGEEQKASVSSISAFFYSDPLPYILTLLESSSEVSYLASSSRWCWFFPPYDSSFPVCSSFEIDHRFAPGNSLMR